jgi:tetratricopeptide (TPR) repeat protein
LRGCATAESQGAKDEGGRPLAARATVFVSHACASSFSALLSALEASEGADAAYFWIGAWARAHAAQRTRPGIAPASVAALAPRRFVVLRATNCAHWDARVGPAAPCGARVQASRLRRRHNPRLTRAAVRAADAFVVSQHAGEPDLPAPFWSDAFPAAVAAPGRSLLVLHPLAASPSLASAWCLWEAFATLEGGARLELALSSEQRDALSDALVRNELTPSPCGARMHPMPAKMRTSRSSSARPASRRVLHGPPSARVRARQAEGLDEVANALGAVNIAAGASSRAGVVAAIAAAASRRPGGVEGVNERLRAGLRAALGVAARGALEAQRARGVPSTSPAKWNAALVAVAKLVRDAGDLAAAEPLYREALALRRAALGDGHAKTLAAVNNLASVCMNQGKLAEAEPLYREALEARTAALGPANAKTLSSAANLAVLLREAGRAGEAEPLFRDVWQRRRDAQGEAAGETLGALNALAFLQASRAGSPPNDALPLLRESLRLHRAALGASHPETQAVADKLAAVEAERAGGAGAARGGAARGGAGTGAVAAAVAAASASAAAPSPPASPAKSAVPTPAGSPAATPTPTPASTPSKQAAPASAAAPEDETPEEARLTALNGDANVLMRGGASLGEAEALYRTVVAGRTSALGESHPRTLEASNNLALCLKSSADGAKRAEAEALLRDVAARATAALGTAHNATLSAQGNLANLLSDAGAHADADALYATVLSVRRGSLGEAHPDTLAAMSNYAVGLQAAGRRDEAEAMCCDALRGRRAALGESDVATLTSLSNLGSMLLAHGKRPEAETLLRDALRLRTLALGESHPDAVDSAHNLGVALTACGKLGEAETVLKRALAARTDALGEAHPKTCATKGALTKVALLKGVILGTPLKKGTAEGGVTHTKPRGGGMFACCAKE